MKQPYLECGKIINLHGFRGAVKMESYCDTPGVLAHLGTLWLREKDGYRPVKVRHASVFRQFVIAELEGVESEDAANRLRGVTVYAAREDLPLKAGAIFIADLIGTPVRHADTGESIGTLTDVTTGATADLYTVTLAGGGQALIPAVPAFVVRTDPDDAIYIRPIPGLLGEEADK